MQIKSLGKFSGVNFKVKAAKQKRLKLIRKNVKEKINKKKKENSKNKKINIMN